MSAIKVGLKNDFENQNFAIFWGSFDSFGRKQQQKKLSQIGDQNCALHKVLQFGCPIRKSNFELTLVGMQPRTIKFQLAENPSAGEKLKKVSHNFLLPQKEKQEKLQMK